MTRMAAICHESVIRLSPAGFDESCMRSRRRPQPRRRRQRSGCDATSRGAARWRCSRSNGLATSTMLAELEVHSVSRATLHLCRWDLSRMFVSGSAAVWCHRCRIRGRRNGARRPAAGRALLAAFRRSPSRLRRLGLRSRSLALAPGATEAIGTTRRGGGPGTRAETGPAPQVRSLADGRNPADHLSGSPARDHAAAIAAIRAQLDGGPLATGRVETRCRAGGAIPMRGWR
jgi:hypothetical protein